MAEDDNVQVQDVAFQKVVLKMNAMGSRSIGSDNFELCIFYGWSNRTQLISQSTYAPAAEEKFINLGLPKMDEL